MRLTLGRSDPKLDILRHALPALSRPWLYAIVVAMLAVIFRLDKTTSSAPLQHLYYLPIIVAGWQISRWAGVGASIAAVVLYHLANPALLTSGYTESDVVQISLFIAVGIVTSTLSENARRLHRLATTDDLTGLHNLRSFEARLKEMARATGETGAPLAMLALDVDRLKSINDAHGHLAGAEAVRTVGHVLAENLPPEAVACRYGGDEFVIALPGRTAEQAQRIADNLCRAVNAVAPVLAGVSFAAGALSISVGVASLARDQGVPRLADDGVVGEALFNAADRALYDAKENGRNRVSRSELAGRTFTTGERVPFEGRRDAPAREKYPHH